MTLSPGLTFFTSDPTSTTSPPISVPIPTKNILINYKKLKNNK